MLGRQAPDVNLKTRVRDDGIGGDNPFPLAGRADGGSVQGQARRRIFAAGCLHADLLERAMPGL